MDSAKPKIQVLERDRYGEPISGRCATCGQMFKFIDTPEGKRVEEAFLTHGCKPE